MLCALALLIMQQVEVMIDFEIEINCEYEINPLKNK